MPNTLTVTGLTTATQAELLAQLTAAYKLIYGDDIVLTSDTPDGQTINIYIQADLDLEDLLAAVYSSMDPDQAIGATLDMRCAINGIQRQGGTFSSTNVTITTSRSVNLYGLDQTAQPVYTVADSSGTQWQLQQTQIALTAGANPLAFQAAQPGAVIPIPNTITVAVTTVLGVTAINNPTTYIVLGVNEESDAALKVRRQKSVSLGSQGYLAGLYAALENVNGVSFAQVWENNTGTTSDGTSPPGIPAGIPGHSIWVIVAGSGAAASIAQAIYTKRNAGCGMYNTAPSGSAESYSVIQPDGSTFIVYWDNVTTIPLYCYFTAVSLNKTAPPNIAAITAGLQNNFKPGVAAQVNANELATLVQEIDPNTLVSNAGFSIAHTQVITLSATAASGDFLLSYNGHNTATLHWNSTAANIQSALRSITGLGSVTVAGTTSVGPFTVTMAGVTNPFLIGANTVTLLTAGSAAITLGFFSNYTSTATPAAGNGQFSIVASEVVVVSTLLAGAPTFLGIVYNINSTTGVVTNTTLAISAADTFTFLGLGGYGALKYSISSGGGSTIDADSGVYVAGSAGTDTITVTDVLGNSAFCTVTVT